MFSHPPFSFSVSYTHLWEVDGLKEQELYQIRENNIEANWESARLSKGEKKYMAEQEEKIEKPLTYEYSDGYQEAGTQMVFVGLLQTLLIAICIPSVFAEEHIRKTDQLNLCTNMGKKTLYLAKIAVGISFSLAATVMMALAITIPTFLIKMCIRDSINICSLFSFLGGLGSPAYAAMKAGLMGLTKAYADELGKYGISVNGIAPGYFQMCIRDRAWSI